MTTARGHLTEHEDALHGDIDVVKDGQGLVPGELGVAAVDGLVVEVAEVGVLPAGMTIISCELRAPVWWALAPRTTMWSAVRRTTRR